MAQIVLGIGTSHSPMLATAAEDYPKHAEIDRSGRKLIDKNGVPHVVWSRANDATVVKDSDLDVPATIKVPGSYLILSRILYRYKPVFGAKLIGPLTFEDHIYMNPRISDSICLNKGSAANPQCVGEGATA